MAELLALTNVHQRLTNPQSSGIVERANGEVLRHLRALLVNNEFKISKMRLTSIGLAPYPGSLVLIKRRNFIFF